MSTASADANIARWLTHIAARRPHQKAVVAPDGRGGWKEIDFAGLEERSNRIASALRARGVEAGARACVFVRPGIDLVALTYALFKLGAVPVLADPGMGRKRLLACMERMAPELFLGIPVAQVVRLLFPRAFRSVRLSVTVGRKLGWGGPTVERLVAEGSPDFDAPTRAADEEAAILFTSGSTGPPKGVLYTHRTLNGQIEGLRTLYELEPGGTDLAGFPLFALFNTALERTSVFPEMDVTRPAQCDPAKIVRAIREHGASSAFGSPAIWRRVVPWCIEHGERLEGLREVLIAGAPVPPTLIEAFHEVLEEGADVHTPYGATEALPVASAAGRELAAGPFERTRNGAGTCVGRPSPQVELRLMEVTDEVVERWSEARLPSPGRPGEVCVAGDVVTELYVGEPGHTAAAKLRDEEGRVWHRMGDVGRLDDEGRLWFLGRKSHRLETAKGLRMPVPAENVFNQHPRVHRSALVGIGPRGEEEPLLVVEPEPGELPRGEREIQAFLFELNDLGKETHATKDVEMFLFREHFPVDVRHNAKIDREALKVWAEGEVRGGR